VPRLWRGTLPSGGACRLIAGKAKRKNFHSLKEKILGWEQIKMWKIFSFCLLLLTQKHATAFRSN